jgi:hypothetical protein
VIFKTIWHDFNQNNFLNKELKDKILTLSVDYNSKAKEGGFGKNKDGLSRCSM